MREWLLRADHHNLKASRGNGPFDDRHEFLGVVLHVNQGNTGSSFWGADTDVNPYSVCPNFEVHKNGSIDQMLPLNWQPWCQIDGNFHYAAIETAGFADEPLTDAQISSCALIVARYHMWMGMTLREADSPGERGLGTHEMGGASWGGHPCPGKIRTRQRKHILSRARMIVDWYDSHGKDEHK